MADDETIELPECLYNSHSDEVNYATVDNSGTVYKVRIFDVWLERYSSARKARVGLSASKDDNNFELGATGTASVAANFSGLVTSLSDHVFSVTKATSKTIYLKFLVYNSSSVVLYRATAKISVPAATYEVRFYGNGSTSGSTATQTKTYNTSLTISSCGFTRTNYDFWHWNTSSTNSGTTYNARATYTTNATLNLYAIWNPRIRYDANGGSLGATPSYETKTYNSSFTITSSRPTRTNYVFNHWNTNASNSGTTYNPGSTIDASANNTILLYAIWDPYIYYNANGGIGAPLSVLKTYGSSYTVSSTQPTRDGYAFTGWNTASNGSGTSYASGSTMSASQNTSVTLYAQWVNVSNAPTISSLIVVRSDANGIQSDTGHFCKVTATWRVDTTCVSSNTGTVTGTIAPENGSARTLTFTGDTTGAGGTVTALYGSDTQSDTEYCSTDLQYTVVVTVTHSATDNPASDRVTSRSDIMTRSHFILDFKAGGKAIGFGSAAPDSGLAIGYETEFTEDVKIDQGLDVVGSVSIGVPLPVASGGTGTADFGEYLHTAISGESISTGTYKSIRSLDLAAGTWIIAYVANFNSNSTGCRRAYIDTQADRSSSTALERSGMAVNAVDGATTCLNGMRIVSLSSAATHYLTAYQNSGGSLMCYGYLSAIRIC